MSSNSTESSSTIGSCSLELNEMSSNSTESSLEISNLASSDSLELKLDNSPMLDRLSVRTLSDDLLLPTPPSRSSPSSSSIPSISSKSSMY